MKRMKRGWGWLLVVGMLLAGGCQPLGSQAQDPTAPPVDITAISRQTPPADPPDSHSPFPTLAQAGGTVLPAPGTPEATRQKLVDLAKDIVAQKFQLSIDQIQLFSIEPRQWPDASLGCPEPGIQVAQVITPGYQIVLEAGGQSYVVHTDETERVILCQIRPPDEIFNPP